MAVKDTTLRVVLFLLIFWNRTNAKIYQEELKSLYNINECMKNNSVVAGGPKQEVRPKIH